MSELSKKWDIHTVGRRKSSVARVYLAKGSGKILVNKRDLNDYFPKATSRYVVNQPVNLLKLSDKFDIYINVKGGGTTGQAGACRLGIARALVKIDSELRSDLRKAGFLTRDSRKLRERNLVNVEHVLDSSSRNVNLRTKIIFILKTLLNWRVFFLTLIIKSPTSWV